MVVIGLISLWVGVGIGCFVYCLGQKENMNDSQGKELCTWALNLSSGA